MNKDLSTSLLKRIFIAFFILLLIPSICFAAEVSQELARQVAENYLHHIASLQEAWVGSGDTSIMDCEPVQYEGIQLAFNFTVYPNGHILVAAWDEFSPVILYSDTSDFIPERVSESGSIESWVIPELYTAYSQIIANANKRSLPINVVYSETRVAQAWQLFGGAKPSSSLQKAQTESTTVTVGPLLSTTWAQVPPYNRNTPPDTGCTNSLVGCVAIAASQLMKYWNWPTIGVSSHSYTWKGQTLSADFNHPYDWSNMPASLGLSSTSTEINAVALLCSDVGIAFDTYYNCYDSSTGIYADAVLPIYFRYLTDANKRRGTYTDSEWFDFFKADLDANPPRPIILSIFAVTGGHEVVVDGYQIDVTNKVHINLGWDGSYDGYYDVTHNFTTGSYTWNASNQVMVANIRPECTGPTFPTLTSPTGTISNTKPTYTWNAVNGVDQYILQVQNSYGTKVINNISYTSSSICSGNTCSVTPGTALSSGVYNWWVKASNSCSEGPLSSPMSFTLAVAPTAPSKVTATAMRNGTTATDIVTLRWQDNSTNETGFRIQYAFNSTFTGTGVVTKTVAANTKVYMAVLHRRARYYFRVQSYSASGTSAYVNASPFPITTP